MHVCIYIYIYMHMCIHTCIIYIYIYIYIYTYICIIRTYTYCIEIHMCIYISVCLSVCMYACMHACMHVCLYVCVFIQIDRNMWYCMATGPRLPIANIRRACWSEGPFPCRPQSFASHHRSTISTHMRHRIYILPCTHRLNKSILLR